MLFMVPVKTFIQGIFLLHIRCVLLIILFLLTCEVCRCFPVENHKSYKNTAQQNTQHPSTNSKQLSCYKENNWKIENIMKSIEKLIFF